MKESDLYLEFKYAFIKVDPEAFIYKIPDTKGLGGKRPADMFVVSKTVAFLIEIKKNDEPTDYQAYWLKRMDLAGGIGVEYDHSKETIPQLVDRIIKLRNDFWNTIC